MVTLCVLLSAIPGRADQLADYEDRVLGLIEAHNGSVVVRMRATEGPYAEIQVIDFASQADLESFQADPKRLALSELRDASIESTVVIRGHRVDGST